MWQPIDDLSRQYWPRIQYSAITFRNSGSEQNAKDDRTWTEGSGGGRKRAARGCGGVRFSLPEAKASRWASSGKSTTRGCDGAGRGRGDRSAGMGAAPAAAALRNTTHQPSARTAALALAYRDARASPHPPQSKHVFGPNMCSLSNHFFLRTHKTLNCSFVFFYSYNFISVIFKQFSHFLTII